MPKYRKRPIVVEAEQWFPGRIIEGVKEKSEGTMGYFIETLEGEMHVSSGDYIITGVKGEKYPCKENIFHITYELVVEE